MNPEYNTVFVCFVLLYTPVAILAGWLLCLNHQRKRGTGKNNVRRVIIPDEKFFND